MHHTLYSSKFSVIPIASCTSASLSLQIIPAYNIKCFHYSVPLLALLAIRKIRNDSFFSANRYYFKDMTKEDILSSFLDCSYKASILALVTLYKLSFIIYPYYLQIHMMIYLFFVLPSISLFSSATIYLDKKQGTELEMEELAFELMLTTNTNGTSLQWGWLEIQKIFVIYNITISMFTADALQQYDKLLSGISHSILVDIRKNNIAPILKMNFNKLLKLIVI
ncbi:hypothetical protein ACJX0J_006509 [Zea mays]